MDPVVPLAGPGGPDEGAAAAADARLLDLLQKYGALLRRTIGKVCPRDLGLSCDDIEQEARVSLWTALRREREIEFPASYIYKVAVSATIRAIRRARARREDQPADVEPADGSSSTGSAIERVAAPAAASPHALAEQGELARTIRAGVAQLPEPRRVAVGLHLQGMTTREIGELVGWTEPKARNLVHRGLKDLRQALRAQGIEYG